jgi:hypothetical protein
VCQRSHFDVVATVRVVALVVVCVVAVAAALSAIPLVKGVLCTVTMTRYVLARGLGWIGMGFEARVESMRVVVVD